MSHAGAEAMRARAERLVADMADGHARDKDFHRACTVCVARIERELLAVQAEAERAGRERQRIFDDLTELAAGWTYKRSHDTEITQTARLGCAEELRETIEGAPHE